MDSGFVQLSTLLKGTVIILAIVTKRMLILAIATKRHLNSQSVCGG